MAFAICRTAKLGSSGAVGASGQHIERTRETKNAEAELREYNRRVAGSGDLWQDVQERMAEAEVKPKKDSVLAIELLLTASPEHFNFSQVRDRSGQLRLEGDFERVERFERQAQKWLEQEFGEKNLVNLTRHMDEGNPHWHAVVVPIVEKTVKVGRTVKTERRENRLSARDFLGGKDKLSGLQDRFAQQMAVEGLQRGLRGSTAKHSKVQAFYGAIEYPETMEGLKERVRNREEARQEVRELHSTVKTLKVEIQDLQTNLEAAQASARAAEERRKKEEQRAQQAETAAKEAARQREKAEFNYHFTKAAVERLEKEKAALELIIKQKPNNRPRL